MGTSKKTAKISIGIVGSGIMGRGIAQVAVMGGFSVKLFDTNCNTAREAVSFVSKMLLRLGEKKRMSQDEVQFAIDRLEVIDTIEGFRDSEIIIEAVTEDLFVKQDILKSLEGLVPNDVILASNTSSISITTIASSCTHPGRIAGFHFFNPVPLMKLVEVVSGLKTETWVIDSLMQLAMDMGQEPVHVNDVPGFVANRIGRAYIVEASNICDEGVATFFTIDDIMRETLGFKMGPFELMDLTGLDISQPVTQLIYDQCFHEPRFRPSKLMKKRADAGFFGKKSGNGFYSETLEKSSRNNFLEPKQEDIRPVWVSRSNFTGSQKIKRFLKKQGVEFDQNARPDRNSLIIIAPMGGDATTFAHEEQLDLKRTIAIDTLVPLGKRRTIMKTLITDHRFLSLGVWLFSKDGVPVSVIHDSPGFITQRVLSMIINIACSIAESGASTPEDIDKVAKLGLGYPFGPLEFADNIGANTILKILETIFKITGDPRYRPTMWLRRRALSGLSLLASAS